MKAALAATALFLVLTLSPAKAVTEVASGPMQTVNPYRVLDTRESYPLQAGQTIHVPTFLPPDAASASVNITLTETAGPLFLTAWDGRQQRPLTSVINADHAGQTIANFAIIPLSESDTFALYTNQTTHVVVDVFGFVAGPPEAPFTYQAGTVITLGATTLAVLDGRSSTQTAISLLDSCQGAVLYDGDLNTTAFIGAHRTACGSRGFGALQGAPLGTPVWVNNGARSQQYELFQVLPGLPVFSYAPQLPAGTNLVLQTSDSDTIVSLYLFRMI